ncbi:MAG: dimethylarginine dimethylaminohydrolase family protein [Pyrinomonadaceae bacterium]
MLVALTNVVSPKLVGQYGAVDYPLALRQHDEYCAALAERGVSVERLAVNASYQNGCFVEDTAVVVDELAVITTMGAASRRGEPAAVGKHLAKYRETVHLSPPAALEGGDVLRVGKRLFVGLSSRTDARGLEELKRILSPFGYDVSGVSVRDGLHLKTACTALDGETLLVNPEWVDTEPFKGFRLLAVPGDEATAANTLRVGDTIFLSACFPRTAEMVRERFARTEVLDISEFRKAEAGLTCLSIIFEHAA